MGSGMEFRIWILDGQSPVTLEHHTNKKQTVEQTNAKTNRFFPIFFFSSDVRASVSLSLSLSLSLSRMTCGAHLSEHLVTRQLVEHRRARILFGTPRQKQRLREKREKRTVRQSA
jgi:hypothetical protein